MPITISRADLSIEYTNSPWGGAVAIVTVPFPDQYDESESKPRTFELKSTEGFEDTAGYMTLAKGGGIHVGEITNISTRSGVDDWRGVYKTFDMNQAIDWLVEYINELIARQEVERKIEGSLSMLSNAITNVYHSLEDSSRRDFREDWQEVRSIFAAVDLIMSDYSKD